MFNTHISEQLAAYLDAQLSPHEAQQAAAHLEQCADCRDEREQVKWGMAMVKHLPLVEAPEEIWSAIVERTPRSARLSETWRIPWWRWALATAVVLVLAGA